MPMWLRIILFLTLLFLVWHFVAANGVPAWLLILFYISLPGFVVGFIRAFIPNAFRGFAKGRMRRRA